MYIYIYIYIYYMYVYMYNIYMYNIYMYIYIGVGVRSGCRPGLRGLRAIVLSTTAKEGGSADDDARKDALLQV
jgi:hypothetical protein